MTVYSVLVCLKESLSAHNHPSRKNINNHVGTAIIKTTSVLLMYVFSFVSFL